MKQVVRTLRRRPGQLRNSSSPPLRAADGRRTFRTSDIILGMTLVVLAIVLVVWLLGQICSQDEQAFIDIENINAGVSHEPV